MKTLLLALILFATVLIGITDVLSVTASFAASPAKVSSPTAASTATEAQRVADDATRARQELAALQQKYRLLDRATVRMGTTPVQEQAVAYYTIDEIVIRPTHYATIEEILAHEIWHIIDWRDNGRIDWGEDLPPKNASDYLAPV